MMGGLSAEKTERQTIMIDATYLKAYRMDSSPRVKKGNPGSLIERTRASRNKKLHTVTDKNGQPLSCFMTAGLASDYGGTSAPLDSPPIAQWILTDQRYDAY